MNSLETSGTHVEVDPTYRDFRSGDVRHSQANITKAKHGLGYNPEFTLFQGIEQAMPWYLKFFSHSDNTH